MHLLFVLYFRFRERLQETASASVTAHWFAGFFQIRRAFTQQVSADELLDWYCKAGYKKAGSYVEAAARLGVDRRTLRRRVTG